MKIFINNEEVLCNSNMVIKEQLKNTSSVILNNVYPKSWENDKDYVSRFYMAKDYSKCKIIDENIDTYSYYDLTNNVQYAAHKLLEYVGTHLIVVYNNTFGMSYVKVPIGSELIIKVNNLRDYQTYGFYETNSMNYGSKTTMVNKVLQPGENTIEVTTTKKYFILYNTSFDIISVKIKSQDNLIFSGVVKNSGNINLNPRYPHYSTLQLLNYKTFLSEGDTLNYVLESQTISSAIKRIVKDLDGFIVGEINIENDDVIAPYNCNNKTVYDVLEYLAEISNSIWFTKNITENLVSINMYSEGNLNQSNPIEYTEEYFRENNIQDIKYSYSAKNYRNKQVITSQNASSGTTQVEYLTYNGTDLKTVYPIEKIVSITSGTYQYSVSTTQAKQNGTYATFYYEYGENNIDVNRSFETGKVFKVTYYSLVNIRQAVYNQKEIERISQTGCNGIIARYEKRTDTNDTNALNRIAQSYLNYKGVPEITLTVKTYFKDILNIGDRVLFEGPLESLTTNYLVISKQIEMVTTGNEQKLWYTYTLNSSFNDENEINFFDNQRRKLEGNIKEGEYITRYIDIPSETNIIFYNLTKSELEIPGDILDGELDIELVGNGVTSNLNAKLEFKL